MTRHRFYIGRESKDGILNPAKLYNEDIPVYLASVYGGMTAHLCRGAWLDPSVNKVKHEASIVFECLETEPSLKAANQVAAYLRDLANQACVLYTSEDVQGEFV